MGERPATWPLPLSPGRVLCTSRACRVATPQPACVTARPLVSTPRHSGWMWMNVGGGVGTVQPPQVPRGCRLSMGTEWTSQKHAPAWLAFHLLSNTVSRGLRLCNDTELQAAMERRPAEHISVLGRARRLLQARPSQGHPCPSPPSHRSLRRQERVQVVIVLFRDCWSTSREL